VAFSVEKTSFELFSEERDVTTRLGVAARAVVLAILLIGALLVIFWQNSQSPEPSSQSLQAQAARVAGGEIGANANRRLDGAFQFIAVEVR
jgi:hypothetical protein